MPAIRKVIKDIVSAPFDKYDKWQSDAKKQSEGENKMRFAREANIRSAQEDERRRTGDLSGEPTIGKALMNIMGESRGNKARGTSSSSVRKIIK
jgi:hypothetical protein